MVEYTYVEKHFGIIIDKFVKSRKAPFFVIPSRIGVRDDGQAGIQSIQSVATYLDSGFHRSDDFLQDRHYFLHWIKHYKGSGVRFPVSRLGNGRAEP